MTQLPLRDLQIAAFAAGVLAIGGTAAWYMLRKKTLPEEVERQRRATLVSSGRIVDGTLIDYYVLGNEEGETMGLLLYNYQVAGVAYECSQDISPLSAQVDPNNIRIGFPCSIRYQPGAPENSIVVAENWSGLRKTDTLLHPWEERGNSLHQSLRIYRSQG